MYLCMWYNTDYYNTGLFTYSLGAELILWSPVLLFFTKTHYPRRILNGSLKRFFLDEDQLQQPSLLISKTAGGHHEVCLKTGKTEASAKNDKIDGFTMIFFPGGVCLRWMAVVVRGSHHHLFV